ncbi:acetylxylan esterase [Chloroflexia bacterium SDU3-3]|nr:acetylxylan esterase [Chloroflexia bacterium SDU3-3]
MHDILPPLDSYKAIYQHAPRSFSAPAPSSSLAQWGQWRTALRLRLRQLLGGLAGERGPAPQAVFSAPTAHQGYTRQHVIFESAPGEQVPAWLLVPDGLAGPAAAALAIPGHSYSVDDTVGIAANGSERATPEGFHQDFAVALCRRGLVVLAPELRGFGRRREPGDIAADGGGNSCRAAAWWGIMLGRPLLGSRVWDSLRAFDLLRSLPQVDAGRVGVMGGSGGGAVAMLAAALEPQIRATVIASYFCSFAQSILAIDHCACNYIPGLLAEAEAYDIAALIAPRPLLIESGDADPIFPIAGVRDAYGRLAESYAALGASDQLGLLVFPGGHQICGQRAYDWLPQQLS